MRESFPELLALDMGSQVMNYLVDEWEGRDLFQGLVPSVHAHPFGQWVPAGKGMSVTQPGSGILALFDAWLPAGHITHG